MKLHKVLIIYKKSSYQAHALDQRDRNYLRLLKERNRAIRRSKLTHDIHLDTLETVKGHLRRVGIPFEVRLRYHLKPIRKYDLVVTIGGDGTFLETSHFLDEGVMLGVNSVPVESVGFFCRTTSDNFLEKIYQYLEGACPIRTLHRLELRMDGKRLGPYCLNDVLFTNRNPAGTTRYVLKVRGLREEQKSSGLWVSPAPGSTAATRSAGGRSLPLGSQKIQYVIREPYEPSGKRYRLTRGILGPREQVRLLSMMDEAALFVDGPHLMFPVRRGSTVVIGNANRPIRAVW